MLNIQSPVGIFSKLSLNLTKNYIPTKAQKWPVGAGSEVAVKALIYM